MLTLQGVYNAVRKKWLKLSELRRTIIWDGLQQKIRMLTNRREDILLHIEIAEEEHDNDIDDLLTSCTAKERQRYLDIANKLKKKLLRYAVSVHEEEEEEEDEQGDLSRQEINGQGESENESTSTNVVCFNPKPPYNEILTSLDFYCRKM
jgi:hypothetical protein